jgi:pimeloyl-ACP methyl ester carboxylesterase
VGVSLGGLGSIQLKQSLGERISGIVLLGPFLGEEDLIDEIENAGGVQKWRKELSCEPARKEGVWLWIDELIESGSNTIRSAIVAFWSKRQVRKKRKASGTVDSRQRSIHRGRRP